MAAIASEGLADARHRDLDDFEYPVCLWLLPGKIVEAKDAALTLPVFPARRLARAYTSLAFKLLALAVGKRRLNPPVRDRCQSLYQELWSVYTTKEERSDRE